ncbi:MAG: hypothetical protein JW974_00170 [Alphaproteobacteria bacterium]|nr:hypothetical protein [Alphaproteobacteria bacterium]MBN2675069.1 hypothetical protein [Alphaproteobacteria bacterium]
MKKLFSKSLIFGILCVGITCNVLGAPAPDTSSSVPWWLQPTVCRPSPTNCYSKMGAGFDTNVWDTTSNCWGMKIICPEATVVEDDTDTVTMSKTELASGNGIDSNFDINVLNGDCFGTRKTTSNGSLTSVDGNFVQVWCNGVLDNPTETLPTGEVKTGTQPTCKELAQNGWVGVLNQRCYGKYFDLSKYYIECEGDNLLPTRIIVLNGSDKKTSTGTAPVVDYPTDTSSATTLFDKMQSVSTAKKAEHF